MELQSAARTSELRGALMLCRRTLAVVRDVDLEAGDDIEVAAEELKSCIREQVGEKRHEELETELFSKLDLTVLKDRWVLCMAVLGPLRGDILHEMYKGFVAYQVGVLHKHVGHTMTEMFTILKGKFRVHDSPRIFMDEMLAALRMQWLARDPEFLKQKMDEYIAEIVIFTCERIDSVLAELAPLFGLGELLQGLTDDGGIRTADELEAAGASAVVVAAARQMQAEAAAMADAPPDELEARERIHRAVLEVISTRDELDIEDNLQQVTHAWAMHPERLTVVTPEGNVPLIEGVMGEPLVTEQIVAAICQQKVTYAEHTAVPS